MRHTVLPADCTERERAAHDLGNTYLVEAAAGTGKTTLLVERVLTIVTTTLAPLTQVAAITFTEKAAGELKARLRARLEEEAGGETEEVERCRVALRDLDGMTVCTIHAFCRELVQQRPVEAGVDPGFGVLDEPAARMLQDEVWTQWMAAEFDHDCAARPFLERDLSIESRARECSLRALFDALLNSREDLNELHVPCADAGKLFDEVATYCLGIEKALATKNGCHNPADLLFRQLEDVARWSAAAESNDTESTLTWLAERPRLKGNRKGSKENWDTAALDAARAFFFGRYEETAARLQRELVSVLAAPLIEWLKGAVRAYDEAKAARGVLDFHDLLISARRMLRDHGDVREYFKTRYNYILVDEFQDTDPLQAEIVFLLAEKAGQSAANWDEVALDQGKLFLVGDPKQSIYRFRRADLDLYGRVKERVSESGECVPIRVNFRSRPELTSEVNALFRDWMTGPQDGRYEPDYVAMEAARESDADQAALLFLSPPENFDLTQGVESLAEAEAACIAEFVREQARRLTVPDGIGGTRALCLRDIGVLYAATTHLTKLENAFKARGIAFQVSGGRALPQRSEIIALRAVLNAMDNPYDENAVVGALRSPFFGCSDEELLEHRFLGGTFDYLKAAPPGSRLAVSFDWLRALHEKRRRCAPSETVMELFDKTAGLAIFALKPQGEARVSNLLKVLDMARALESAGSFSFHRLARGLDRLEEMRAGEEDYPGDSEDDAVQFLTFHKAKGLEFPVVILYRLTQGLTERGTSIVHERGRKAVEFRSAAGETAGFAAAAAEEEERRKCENLRLLYVACTRARELLVIPAYWQSDEKAGRASGFVSVLQSRFPRETNGRPRVEGTGFQIHETNGYRLESEPQEGLLLDVTKAADERAAETSRREREEWERSRTAAVTGLDHSAQFVRPSEPEQEPEERALPQGRPPHEAMVFGQYAHQLLQKVSLPKGENLDELTETMADDPALTRDMRAEGADLVRRALTSALFRERIAKAESVYRELGFTAMSEGKLMEGAIDLLFFEGGEAVIVDFKTDKVTREEAAARAESYRHQTAAYAKALEAVLKRPVHEVILHFLRPEVTISERMKAEG
jgi:ATP-dependent helicase/nuclease subunit A